MAISYTLTSEPTPVTEAGYPDGALIYNTGTSDAYASEDPGGQVTGFPVPAAGGSLTWDANRPLYLSAGAGQTTSVVVDDNSSSTVSSPVDLANAIISAGLAQDIADQISLKGVPAIDNPTTLVDGVFTAGAGQAPYNYFCQFGSAALGQSLIDVSDYQSLTISFLANLPAATTQYYMWLVEFFSDAAQTHRMAAYAGEGMASGSMFAIIPAAGRYVRVTLAWKGGTLASAPSFFFTLTGSYRSVPAYHYQVLNDLWENATTTTSNSYSGTSNMKTTIAGGVGQQFYPSYSNAPMRANLWITGTSSSASCSLNVTDQDGNYFGGWPSIQGTGTPAGFLTTDVYFGCNQPRVNITNNSASTSYGITLAMAFQQ